MLPFCLYHFVQYHFVWSPLQALDNFQMPWFMAAIDILFHYWSSFEGTCLCIFLSHFGFVLRYLLHSFQIDSKGLNLRTSLKVIKLVFPQYESDPCISNILRSDSPIKSHISLHILHFPVGFWPPPPHILSYCFPLGWNLISRPIPSKWHQERNFCTNPKWLSVCGPPL